ncbi:alpha/beta fold hydrolase [Zavarzinia compransoris]|uniref:3-oxoacyl-ACP reductase n=1 Tax=Zavarzinia compransoris TaxID=1264899 RepID=A0A317DZ77_9PROT|nr:alpha/beta hydrolase [Zavarzinia compransoris]PWR19186.1 3-oxoacyl-ACP reductase [Zavarzinia compransoris]TDP49203.1 4,5:9,10-diseco-3-hydroxy-5,9,17-trioxoandrosta-1(10),2-diene-4-oate hydrolase [Zavarzinia compransoris]
MSETTPIPVGKYLTLKSGHRLHYHEAGTPSADKPTILCLHGSGPGASGYSNFKGNMTAFAAAGHHVLVPDYLGFGLSDMPEDVEYSTDLHVPAMKELVDALGVTQVVPIGNSLGGAIALQFTLTYPGLVPKLILMAPGGLQEPQEYAFSMPGVLRMLQFVSNRPFEIDDFRDLLGHLVHDLKHITDEAVDERYPVALRQPIPVYASMRVGVYADRLHEIACPVLAFWGTHDKFLPVAHAQILAEKLPQAKVILSNQCGHWVMIEDRDYFNAECIAFLGRATV